MAFCFITAHQVQSTENFLRLGKTDISNANEWAGEKTHGITLVDEGSVELAHLLCEISSREESSQ